MKQNNLYYVTLYYTLHLVQQEYISSILLNLYRFNPNFNLQKLSRFKRFQNEVIIHLLVYSIHRGIYKEFQV